jgi:hypothetical protein
MAPGGRVGPQYGELFLHVFILEKYIRNLLLKNYWAIKAEGYMKYF